MDDIAIQMAKHPHKTEEQHTTHHREYVHQMLDKLEEHNLYLKPEKCQFEKDRIKYLSVIIGKGQLQMSPKKLQGIADWSPPRNPTEVCSFLGFMGYYRYFVPNYLKIAQPLLDLTKKTTPWNWREAQHKAFEELKHECVEAQYLSSQMWTNNSHSMWMPQLMVWAPYSHRRETTPQKPWLNATNHIYTQLHTIQLPSHPLNETTTYMRENC